jgi:hypothetical protein
MTVSSAVFSQVPAEVNAVPVPGLAPPGVPNSQTLALSNGWTPATVNVSHG